MNANREAYSQAAQQIQNTAPKGGQRDQALTSLAQGQAGSLSSILTGGVQNAVQNLSQIGQFGNTASLQGLQTATSAGSSLASLAAAQSQAWGSAIGGVLGGAGSVLGGAAGNPAKGSVPSYTGGAVGVQPLNTTNPGYYGAGN